MTKPAVVPAARMFLPSTKFKLEMISAALDAPLDPPGPKACGKT